MPMPLIIEVDKLFEILKMIVVRLHKKTNGGSN